MGSGPGPLSRRTQEYVGRKRAPKARQKACNFGGERWIEPGTSAPVQEARRRENGEQGRSRPRSPRRGRTLAAPPRAQPSPRGAAAAGRETRRRAACSLAPPPARFRMPPPGATRARAPRSVAADALEVSALSRGGGGGEGVLPGAALLLSRARLRRRDPHARASTNRGLAESNPGLYCSDDV